MRFPFESKLLNYVTSWYQIQDKPRSGQRRFHGAHTARIAASYSIRTQKRPAGGNIPLRASPGACGARRPHPQARLRAHSPETANAGPSGAGVQTAPIEKRPPRARRPALPQPCAAVLSAKAGLTAGFGMGPGDPRLCGRARGGRSPAALIFEPARNPCPGRPWRPHGGHGRKIAHRARCFDRGCEELGLLVPLG